MPPKATTMTNEAEIAIMQRLHQGAAAWLCGCAPRIFRDKHAPRNADGSYDARTLAAWLQESSAPSDDPLLGVGDSPNLERYRAAKASLAEMEVSQRRGQLCDVDQLVEWWSAEIAAPLRRDAATLLAQFGPDAETIITD